MSPTEITVFDFGKTSKAPSTSFSPPDIFPVEIGHVFSKMHRQRTLTEEEAQAYFAEVMSTSPELHRSLPLIPRAYVLSL
jgi:hypothetical protein